MKPKWKNISNSGLVPVKIIKNASINTKFTLESLRIISTSRNALLENTYKKYGNITNRISQFEFQDKQMITPIFSTMPTSQMGSSNISIHQMSNKIKSSSKKRNQINKKEVTNNFSSRKSARNLFKAEYCKSGLNMHKSYIEENKGSSEEQGVIFRSQAIQQQRGQRHHSEESNKPQIDYTKNLTNTNKANPAIKKVTSHFINVQLSNYNKMKFKPDEKSLISFSKATNASIPQKSNVMMKDLTQYRQELIKRGNEKQTTTMKSNHQRKPTKKYTKLCVPRSISCHKQDRMKGYNEKKYISRKTNDFLDDSDNENEKTIISLRSNTPQIKRIKKEVEMKNSKLDKNVHCELCKIQ